MSTVEKLSDFVWFYFFLHTFATKLRDAHFVDHWNILIFCDLRTIISDLNMPWGKMSKFVSFLLFALTFVIKLKDLEFKIHSNTFFNRKKWSQIWICSLEKYLTLVQLPCFTLTFVVEIIYYFLTKEDWCQIWICSAEHCLILLNLPFLCSLLTMSEECKFLNLYNPNLGWVFSDTFRGVCGGGAGKYTSPV